MDLIPDDQVAIDTPAPSQGASGNIPDSDVQLDSDKYGSLGQQFGAAAEGVAQGFAGPLAPYLETTLGGIPAADIAGRAAASPWVHGLSEAAGLGAGLLTGTGEAALIGHAGEAAAAGAGALGLLGEGASVGSRLAAGATKVAAEGALYGASDQGIKAVLDDPNQTPGSVAGAIGLSAVLGGLGGAAGTGIGMGAKAAINSQFLKSFIDRLAVRGADLNPAETLEHEFGLAHQAMRDMGTEVGGVNGVGAAARDNLMPPLSDKMTGQAQDILDRINTTAEKLQNSGDTSGARLLQEQASHIESAINSNIDPFMNAPRNEISPGTIYDTLNGVKRQLGEWGQFNKDEVPLGEVAFRNAAKGIGSDLKGALEDSDTWGGAGDLQKSLNGAWSNSIDAVKDAQKRFMQKVMGQYTVDPQKFNTYLNQNGRVTSQSIRQKTMGNFVDAVESFQKATGDAYEKAGLENPHPPVGLGALKDSLGVHDTGSKLADLWYDKLGAKGLGDLAGGATGGALGHATGIPEAGFGGAYLGKWVLGPVFSSVIKPLMEKGANMPAFQKSLSYATQVLKGNHELTNAAASVFGPALKTLPSRLYPEEADTDKLDKTLKAMSQSPQKIVNVAGAIGDYMPAHAQAMRQTAVNASSYLNSQRPGNVKANPLDTDIPVSKAQKAPFQRSLAIAQQPLLAFQHIKDGTLQAQDVNTIKAIYPDHYPKMSQELMTAMVNHTQDGGTVPYKQRQSVSLFLGQPMDSTMTPSAIQSIQGVFAANRPAPPSAPAPKKKESPSKLGKISENQMTLDQQRTSRANG